jgi:hypothetical protein
MEKLSGSPKPGASACLIKMTFALMSLIASLRLSDALIEAPQNRVKKRRSL